MQSNGIVNPTTREVKLSSFDIDRFFRSIMSINPNECWIWKSRTDKDGYGKFSINKRHLRANRVSWIIHNDQIGDGLHVLHNCPSGDNPACVNPAHLWLGTNADNTADRDAKKRTAKGAFHGMAKITEAQARAIKELQFGGLTYNEIGKRFGITRSMVCRIFTGRAWTHLK